MKKFLRIILVLVLLLGISYNFTLADNELMTKAEKIDWLVDKEVVKGRKVNADGSADLALNESLTRAETVKLVVHTLGLEEEAEKAKGDSEPFPDVPADHWANGYVAIVSEPREEIHNGRRLIQGYEDGTFHPDDPVTYAEMVTIMVRTVKEDLTPEMEENAKWPDSYTEWGEEEGVTDGVIILDSDVPIPRDDAFATVYNSIQVSEGLRDAL